MELDDDHHHHHHQWEVDEYEWDQVNAVGRRKEKGEENFLVGIATTMGETTRTRGATTQKLAAGGAAAPAEEEEEEGVVLFGKEEEKNGSAFRPPPRPSRASSRDSLGLDCNPLFVGVSRGARERDEDERRFLIGQRQKENAERKRIETTTRIDRSSDTTNTRSSDDDNKNGSVKVPRSSSNSSIKDKVVQCRVDGCEMKCERVYAKRSKVCEMHLKMDEVFHEGMLQRFCQKCTRFHSIEEFKDKRRACAFSLSKLAKVRAPTGGNGVGASIMTAAAKRTKLNADKSELTFFNGVPLDAMTVPARNKATKTKQQQQQEQQQRNSNTSNSKSPSLVRKENSGDSNTYANGKKYHHEYERQQQGQSTMREMDVLDFAFPDMEEDDAAYLNDFDGVGEQLRPHSNVLGLFSYDFTTGKLQNRDKMIFHDEHAEEGNVVGDLNAAQEGARKYLGEIGSDKYSGAVDEFFEQQQQQQKSHADKLTDFPDVYVSRAEIKISDRTPADISPAVGKGIRQSFKDAAHIRVCAEPGCTKLTVDAVFPDIVRRKKRASPDIKVRELAQKVVDADRSLDDVDASVTFQNQIATRMNGKWSVSDEKPAAINSFGRNSGAPWSAPFVLCTNPSAKKPKDTINRYNEGKQQNNGSLFYINNVAENVDARVRINGQILKDLKPLGRIGSDRSVLCFSVPQDYAEGVLSVDLIWSDNEATESGLIGKAAYNRFTAILTPEEKVANEIQSFIMELHSWSPRVAQSLRTHFETIFAEDFRYENFERPMFREMAKNITSWSLRNKFSHTAERLLEGQRNALESLQLSSSAHTALARTCQTYLHSAALSGSSNLVKMVIIQGGDYDIFGSAVTMVTLPDGSEESALHVASSDVFAPTSTLVVELFLLGEENLGAFFTLKNSKGETARDILSEYEFRGSLQNAYVKRCMQSALIVFWNVSKAIVDKKVSSIAMRHRLFEHKALSYWMDAYEEVCGISSDIIDDMKTKFDEDAARSSGFAVTTSATVANAAKGNIDVLLEADENNEGMRHSLELAMVLSWCDHVVREVCDEHFARIRRAVADTLNKPAIRTKEQEENDKKREDGRGSSDFTSEEVGGPPRCADSFLKRCFLHHYERKSWIAENLTTCAIRFKSVARARIARFQNAWHRSADYVAGMAVLSFDEPEMEKLYVHEDSTEKISTDLFVHLFYSLATVIAYVRFYRANQLFDMLFSPFTFIQLFKKFAAICTAPALCYLNYFKPKFYVRHREAINVASRISLSFFPSGNKQLENVIMPVLVVLKVVMFRLSSALWPIRAERHACMVILGEILNPTCVSSILSVYAIIPMFLNICFCFSIELRQRRMFACKYGCVWLNQRWSVFRSKSGKRIRRRSSTTRKVYTTKKA
jgi:hypothetical protein